MPYKYNFFLLLIGVILTNCYHFNLFFYSRAVLRQTTPVLIFLYSTLERLCDTNNSVEDVALIFSRKILHYSI